MSWIEKNQKPLLAVGAILGIAWFGGRYFDESESYSAENVKIDWEAVAKEEWDSGYPHDDDLLSYQNKQANKSLLSCLNSYLKVAKDEVTMGHYDYPDLAEHTITPEYEKAYGREPTNAEIDKALPKVIKGLRKQARTGRYRGADWEELSKALKAPTSRYEWGQGYEGAYYSKGRKGWFTGDDEYEPLNAETFHAEKKPLARNTIKAKGRNSYDRFKHIMEMKVKMLSPHFKKKYAKENRLPSFTSGGTTRYWQAYVDGWREMENAKVKDMGDVIGLGFKPENAFSVNEYWGRIDGAEAYLDWSAGRKDASGYYSKSYYIPTEEYDVMNAETFDAMSFKQWSDDEMHEPKHGGSQMQFDDWLEEEIDSHGDIPLSKWGYEEEHDEKEHQHSESFNANERKYQAVDVPLGMVCVLCEKDKPATHRIVENGMPFFLCEKHWFNYTMGASNIHADLGAETFEAQSKLPKLTPKQMDFLRYSPWAMAYNAYARGTGHGSWLPKDWKEDYTICRNVTGDGWGNENIARRMLQSLLEKKVVAATKTSFVDYDGRIRKSYAEQVNENPALVKNISSVCLVLTPIGVEIIKRDFARQVKDVVGWKIQLALGNGQISYLDNVPTDIAQSLDEHIGGVKWDSQKEKFEAEYAEEMACETCGCKKKAETFEAKGDCKECYGTGGLYDSHMGINDECHFCGGTGFEY